MAKKNKMIQCKYCGAEISAGAKTCPHCGGKNKKPLYKKVWFWLLVFVLLIALGSCGGGSNEKADEAASVSEVNTEQTVAAESEIPETTASEAAESEAADNISKEYQNALVKAESYANLMHMSKKGVYDQLTSEYGEGFEEDAAQYAVDHVKADWNANALAKAEDYSDTMHMSKASIYDQLTSEYGEQFTEEEAQYAVDHIEADWNANALEKAKDYQDNMNMSKSAIYDQLISEYGEQFTADQAQYAVDHLDD